MKIHYGLLVLTLFSIMAHAQDEPDRARIEQKILRKVWFVNACGKTMHVKLSPIWSVVSTGSKSSGEEGLVELIGPMEYSLRIPGDSMPHKIDLDLTPSNKAVQNNQWVDLSQVEKCIISVHDKEGNLRTKEITIENEVVYLARFLRGDLIIEKLRKDALSMLLKRFRSVELEQ